MGVRVNLIGQLALSEIFAILDNLSLKKWVKTIKDVPDSKKICIAYSFILLSQMISDVVNGSNMNDLLRGWANILMAIFLFMFLIRSLNSNVLLIIFFLCGLIVRLILLDPIELSGEMTLDNMPFFKFKLVPILSNLILVVSWYLLKKRKINKLTLTVIMIVFGLFCMAFDARSGGLFMILTAIIFFNKNIIKRITLKKVLLYTFIFGIVFQGLYSIYVSQVLAGNLGGEHSRGQLLRVENPYNPVNLLMSGRAETFVAIQAIMDKPIFGHGSWASDKDGKYTYMLYVMSDSEDQFISIYRDAGRLIIPSHSVLLGAWVTAGFGGFLAILYIFVLFLKRGISLIGDPKIQNSPYILIVINYLLNGTWIFLFSPITHIRYTLPIMLAFIFIQYRNHK
jgi:O-antigen ligase